MDFSPSPKVEDLRGRLVAFMQERVYRAEALAERQIAASGDPHHTPAILRELQAQARTQGLWNLFLPGEHGAGLTNWEYGLLCEVMGRSLFAPRVFNCAAPDTGNMEILLEFGTAEQKKRWLDPMLAGEMRSCFAMTEPATAGSDPTLLEARAVRDGDDYVINGHKWFITGAYGAAFAIVMAVTDPGAPRHHRASMLIVPADTPGFHLVRAVSVMGHAGDGGHAEIRYEDCHVPAANLLGEEGGGFAIAQARLGPGRIHHCMRSIGAAERALELMCVRANSRHAHGSLLAEKGVIQNWIAESRIEIDAARLMVLHAAWKMDTVGKREARQEISMIKVIVPNTMMRVLDRAIQLFGAMGMSDDTPIARMWREGRAMRIADGPDEVHKMTVARRELRRWPAP